MADSTSANGGKNLATIGTPHAGMTVGPTDVCKLPNNMPAPFPNIAPTNRAPVGMTSPRTAVNTKQIITVATQFGSPSDPAHAGVNKGVRSLTYCSYAEVQVGSQDLRTEGKAPGRHLDDTFQNKRNTVGVLKDLNKALDAANKNAGKLKRCTIVLLEVEQDQPPALPVPPPPPPGTPAAIAAAKSPPPAPGPAPPRKAIGGFLEIVEGSTLTCTSHRKNMAAATVGQPPMNAPPPDCSVPAEGFLKSKFRVVRSGGIIRQFSSTTLSPPGPRNDTKEGIDVYKLDASWVGDPPSKAAKMSGSKGTKGPTEAMTRAGTAASITGQQMGSGPPNAGGSALGVNNSPQLVADQAAFRAAKQKAQYDAYKKTKDRIQAAEAKFKANASRDAKIITSLQVFRDLWSSFVPPQIVVSASACTGAFATLVKVYPAGEFEFDLIEVFKTFVKPFEKAIDGFKGLFKGLRPRGGSDWDVGILNQSLVGGNAGDVSMPTLKIAWEFKELARDAANGGPKQHCVGLSWKLVVGVQKLVFARADFSVSLFVIAGGPGFGLAAKKILDWCGIKFDLGLALEMAVGVTALIGRTEYHIMRWAEVASTLTLIASVYLLARAGDFGSAKCDFSLAFSMEWSNTRYRGGVRPVVDFLITKRRLTFAFQATITANVIGFREGKKFPDEPYDIITPVTWPDQWMTVPL